jgi:glycerol-3-phosphate dehydrogenase
MQSCDVLVVGGGINGAGIARDLAGRGHAVVLAEALDLAQHTSSASTKLIHGGLRYLEHREFGLVRKALQERERLLRSAPHIMWPLRFVMPHDPQLRPAWLIRAGLFLYDHLARREWLPGAETLDLRRHAAGAPLLPRYTRGFAYSDGWVDDARLVLLNALDAQDKGARVWTRCPVRQARRQADHWQLRLGPPGQERELRARVLVNAAGPWAASFLQQQAQDAHGQPLASHRLRLVRGSHIVVPRCFDHEMAYLFQNPDGRILFAIPYEQDFTLIGTTDVELAEGPPQDLAPARASVDEVDYLCAQASRYFARPVTPGQVRWCYAGVRPLLDDEHGNPAAVTRDYRLELQQQGGAPLLNVWGGKLTTYRRLAEEAADLLGPALGRTVPAWTARAHLPGGDLSAWLGVPGDPQRDMQRFVLAMRQRWEFLPPALAWRLARAYGARVERLLGGARGLEDLGAAVAPGLHEAELDFLRREEWARSAEDVLWRRSKLGLHYSAAEREAVARAWG